MRRLWLVAILQLMVVFGYGQNVDTVAKSIDSSNKIIQKATKETQRLPDSPPQEEIRRYYPGSTQNLERFLADMKERERKEKQQTYIRIGLGAAFLIVLIVGLARRRKKNGSAN